MTLPPERRRAVLRTSLGVGVATGAYGVSFGALATASGLDVLQACALSLLAFSGASQFAFVGVVAGGGALLSGTATSVLLGARNGFYGLRIAEILRVRGVRRLAAAQLTIDESTAVAVAQPEEPAARLGFWSTGLAIYVLWNLATLVGAIGGTAMGDPAEWGLDAAAPAAFLALVAPRLQGRRTVLVAVVAALLALALVPVSPAGVPVMAGALLAVTGAVLVRASAQVPR
ncbi:AzlC family ABC transporter permease [Motilibacter aurantiacus]|uniref:AzlC family ABC transporter permease n=1 Tax=Motilibacter aurantiacus TaxID=2714955 RepID=UPI00140B5205|nr:AzlC family ABC transporter permease [Motilibacter aurantiacus]NHC44584.1 AzlC family ABC transporter permease [Motilibacter aurantiacus]